MHSILNLAQLLENGSWVWYISFPRDKRPTQPMLSLSPSVGISSPVSYLVHAPLCCFNVSVWPLANGLVLCGRERGLPLWHNQGVHGILPCISWLERPVSHGVLAPTIEPVLSLCKWSIAPCPVWLCYVSQGDWYEGAMCRRLLFLMVGTVMNFVILFVVGVLHRDKELVHSVLLNYSSWILLTLIFFVFFFPLFFSVAS